MRTHPWPKRVDAILLRDPVPADVDVIAGFRNAPDVSTWLIVTEESPTELQSRWLGVAASETDYSCVAEVDGTVVGVGFLEVTDGVGQPGKPRGTEAGIGYIVRPDHAGRGIGSAIAAGLVEAAFRDLGVRRVTAGCFADNHASVRILEKSGLRREQHGRADSWHAELGWVDGYTYAALATEWSSADRGDFDRETALVPPRRTGGSRLRDLPRHELRTASSIGELLAEERDR